MSKPDEKSRGVRVRGQAGKGKWPLKGITEGTFFAAGMSSHRGKEAL